MKKVMSCFVSKFDDKKVECYFPELKEHRESGRYPLFADMKLFKGKNIMFTIELSGSKMIISCSGTDKNRIKQIWNYIKHLKF